MSKKVKNNNLSENVGEVDTNKTFDEEDVIFVWSPELGDYIEVTDEAEKKALLKGRKFRPRK